MRSRTSCWALAGTVRHRAVSTGPGAKQLTAMPKGASSLAACRVSCSVAAFITAYGVSPAKTRGTATVLNSTIMGRGLAGRFSAWIDSVGPDNRGINLGKSRTNRQAARRFNCHCCSHAVSLRSSMGWMAACPAA